MKEKNIGKKPMNVPAVSPADGSRDPKHAANGWRTIENGCRTLQDRLASAEELLARARSQCDRLLEEQRGKEAGVQRLMQAIGGYDYHVLVKNGRPVSTIHGKGCAQVTGYAPHEFAADPFLWYHMIQEEDRLKVIDFFKDLLLKGEAGYLDHRIRHRSGALRWVRNHPVALFDAAGMLAGYDGVIVDITETKQLEDKVRQAQRMEVIGAMFGGIIHDFNNLITAMAGHAYILSRQFDADDPRGHSAKCLIDVSERAKLLTGRLFSFTRNVNYHLKAVRINEVIEGLDLLMRPLTRENIAMEVRLSPDDPVVTVDRGQIEQVLMNLMVNAIDAMSNGGKLTLTTAVVDRSACHGSLPAAGRNDQLVMVSVADTGGGMTPDVQLHMYEPFFTTKMPGKGSGLGLSIVHSIMKQHGGSIACSSEPGHGAEFRLYFPHEHSVQQEAPQPPPASLSGAEHVLVVDDDIDVLAVMAEALEKLGFTVTTAAGGDEAIALFRERAEDIQCIVLDYALPGMTGVEVYEEMEKVRPHVPVVFISGYPAESSPLKDISYPHSRVLYKPFFPSDLGQAVQLTIP